MGVSDMKCDNCMHKEICKHLENMKKFESEIREKERLLENKTFHAEIRCENFQKLETVRF